MRRLLDLAFAVPLLILVFPLGLAIAAVLAVTGEREIFYAQDRVGRDGRPFRLLKFATMLKDSPNLGTGTVTVPGDPRVLPFGRLLRKSKLNELPQLLNVVRGDIGLVGPRPLTPQTFGYYPRHVRERITAVKPGLTGVGSIVFRDEERVLAESPLPPVECYRREIAPHKGELELWYLENRSLGLDLRLLLLTAVVVVAPRSRLPVRLLRDLPQRSAPATSGG